MKRVFAHPAAPALFSALVALIVYSVTLGGTFVYDDFDVFALDARLREPSQWWRYFTESYNGGVDNLYRPLVSMTYAIQWWLHGDQIKWPYHAVNWILHAGVAALVAELTRRLLFPPGPPGGARGGRGRHAPLIAGLLFAVHPIHVEAVANVVGRAELLCAIGFLGALVLLAHRPVTTRRAIAIFGCLILAILSKEQGMLLPPMLLAMAWVTKRDQSVTAPIAHEHSPGDPLPYATKKPRARMSAPTMLLTILICWSVAGYIVFRESILKFSWDRGFLDWTINPLVRATGAQRWLMPFTILGQYVALLIAPFKLSPDYGAKVIGWAVHFDDPHFWIGIASTAACGFAILFAWRKRNRVALFCLLGLILTYGLISNFVILIGTNFGERLMYLPSAFFLILIAIGAARFKPILIALSIVIVVFSIRTVTYAQRWNDRQSFYEYSISRQPNSIRLRMLLIAELQHQRKLDQADRVASDARELLPEYDEIWLQSADIAADRRDFDRAQEYLDRAMQIRPREKTAGRMQLLHEQRAAAATQPK